MSPASCLFVAQLDVLGDLAHAAPHWSSKFLHRKARRKNPTRSTTTAARKVSQAMTSEEIWNEISDSDVQLGGDDLACSHGGLPQEHVTWRMVPPCGR